MKIHINKIVESIEKGNCVFFIGAGISASCGLPSGSDLTKNIAKELNITFKNRNLPEIAEFYKTEFSKIDLIELVRKSIEIDIPDEKLTAYKIIKRLPINIILTTNYDNLLQKLSNDYNVINRNNNIWKIDDRSKNIIKIHGDLDFTDDLILTESDFYKYEDKYPNILSYLKYIFSSKLIVFLGFGLRDLNTTNILFWINKTLHSSGRNHYAVLKSVNKNYKDVLESRNIKVIKMDAEKFLIETAKKLNIDLAAKEEINFNAFYMPDIINFGEESNINFEFKNNTNDVIQLLSYKFEAYHNGTIIAIYAKHSFLETIQAKKEFKKNFNKVNPLQLYFSNSTIKGEFSSRIFIEYVKLNSSQNNINSNVKTIISIANLLVK
jgi:hypothetical protein